MNASVLGSVTLGYEAIWNPQRSCAGVRLLLAPVGGRTVSARHLLEAIASQRPANGPILLLHAQSPALLSDLLDRPPAPGIWLEVPQAWMGDAAIAARVQTAQAQGWPCKNLHTLTPHEALAALRAGRQAGAPSPVQAGQLYHGLPSQALVEHALDQQHAWGVAGWPIDEILHGYRLRQILPSHAHIHALLKALERDASFDRLEQLLCEDPLLTYRFLRYANSALVGARSEVASVRQGLMVMGHTQLRHWLAEQLPTANEDINLAPIRASMVLRAELMAHLCQAGLEDALRREVYLCGIFSQLDLLLGEPLGAAIHRLPLPGRIASAIVGQTGPYAPWLATASALESGNPRVIEEVSRAHGLAADEVNRALLRALAGV